jgi:hypothetical protein
VNRVDKLIDNTGNTLVQYSADVEQCWESCHFEYVPRVKARSLPHWEEIIRKKKKGAGFGPNDHDKIRLCPNKCPEARGSAGIYLMLR